MLRITCDASFDRESGRAGIACCQPGGLALNARVVAVEGNNQAEAAAVLLAATEARRRKMKNVEFLCDNTSVVGALTVLRPCVEAEAELAEIRRLMIEAEAEGYVWRIRRAQRAEVSPAHRLAGIAYRCWRRGREAAAQHDSEALVAQEVA